MRRGGIVLSGHTDVVPVDGQPWDTDPFDVDAHRRPAATAAASADMKSFIAIGARVRARDYCRRGLERPLHFALSYDEEVGCIGVRRLISRRRRSAAYKPGGCIVGEPTGMELVVAHKGKKS